MVKEIEYCAVVEVVVGGMVVVARYRVILQLKIYSLVDRKVRSLITQCLWSF